MAPLDQVDHFIVGPSWRSPFSAAAAGEHPRRPRGPVDYPGLDLDGNGHLDAQELKQALLCAASKTVTIEVDIDDRVDEMIGWADMSDDGVVTFEVRVRPPPLPKART